VVSAPAGAFTLEALRILAAGITLVERRVALELNHPVRLDTNALAVQAAEVLGTRERRAIMLNAGQKFQTSEVLHVGHNYNPLNRHQRRESFMAPCEDGRNNPSSVFVKLF